MNQGCENVGEFTGRAGDECGLAHPRSLMRCTVKVDAEGRHEGPHMCKGFVLASIRYKHCAGTPVFTWPQERR